MKTLSRFSSISLVTMATILGASSQALAGSLTIQGTNVTSFGNYSSNATGTRTGNNLLTGRTTTTGTATTADTNRGFITFNLAGTNLAAPYRTILNSKVQIFNPTGGYLGPSNSSARLNITEVSPTANLTGNSTATFTDLGTGTGNYGSTLVGNTSSNNSNNTTIVVDLGTNANSNIRTQANSSFSVGTALNNFSTGGAITLFNNVNTTTAKQLIIQYADAQASTNGNQSFGNILVGQSANANVIVTNTGEQGSSLSGSIGASDNALITSSTSGLQSFSNLGKDQTETRTFIFAPTQRTGLESTVININSNTLNPITNPTLTGRGVAPVNEVTVENNNAGYVRIGTSRDLSIVVKNIGDGNLSGRPPASSNLIGAASATGSSDFLGDTSTLISLGDGLSQTLTYTYAPTDRGQDTAQVNILLDNGSADGKNKGSNQQVTLAGIGVGPEFDSSIAPGSTIDFSTVPVGQTKIISFVISNNAQTPAGADPALTQLTLRNILFDRPDVFSVLNFSPDTVLAAGEQLQLQVEFRPLSEGDFQASLRILTDQGADIGGNGDEFGYTVQGTASPRIPEPSSVFGLLTLIGTGMLFPNKKMAKNNS